MSSRKNPDLTRISDTRSGCGEGPIWNAKTRAVTWVDIAGNCWHQTILGSNKTTTHPAPSTLGALVERKSGGYVAATKEGFADISPDGTFTPFAEFLGKEERFNDAKADASGRWWAGSLTTDFVPGRGRIWALEADRTYREVEVGFNLPNGIGWSPDNKFMYFADSTDHVLWRFDFDLATGTLRNKKDLVRFDKGEVVPDGLTMTDDGKILLAMWNGFRIEVINPDGSREEPIQVPVKRPTSCCFVGDKRDILILTSATSDVNPEAEEFTGQTMAISGLGFTGAESEKFGG